MATTQRDRYAEIERLDREYRARLRRQQAALTRLLAYSEAALAQGLIDERQVFLMYNKRSLEIIDVLVGDVALVLELGDAG